MTLETAATYRLREAGPGDADALADFGARIFSETFAHLYPRADFDAYLATAYGRAQQQAEIAEPGARFCLAESGGALIGYCFLSRLTLAPVRREPAREIRRFYIDQAWHGAGAAQALMRDARAWAEAQGAAALYLGVWENNPRAQRFYAKHGFEIVGEHDFWVGGVKDRDLIMRLELAPAR